MLDTLVEVLRPHDPAQLREAAIHNRRLHLHTATAEDLASLLPWTLFNDLITPERLLSGKVQATRQGMNIPIEMLADFKSGIHERILLTRKIQSLCDQGLSFVINSIDELVPQIAALSATMERFFRAPVHANCYASFTRDSAFKAHWDNQNVLILQVHGRKRWWCHGQPFRHPIHARQHPVPRDLGPAEFETVLEPGDALFIPRGDVHRAQVEGAHSLHLTVTIVPPRGEKLLRHLTRLVEQSELGRQDLPMLADLARQDAWMADMKALLHESVERLDLQTVLQELDTARELLPVMSLGLQQGVGVTTRVRPAIKRRLALPAMGGEGAELVIADQRWRLSGAELAVLALLLERDCLQVGELADKSLLSLHEVTAAVEVLAKKSLVLLSP
jgi:Cupin superfamily protein